MCEAPCVRYVVKHVVVQVELCHIEVGRHSLCRAIIGLVGVAVCATVFRGVAKRHQRAVSAARVVTAADVCTSIQKSDWWRNESVIKLLVAPTASVCRVSTAPATLATAAKSPPCGEKQAVDLVGETSKTGVPQITRDVANAHSRTQLLPSNASHVPQRSTLALPFCNNNLEICLVQL